MNAEFKERIRQAIITYDKLKVDYFFKYIENKLLIDDLNQANFFAGMAQAFRDVLTMAEHE